MGPHTPHELLVRSKVTTILYFVKLPTWYVQQKCRTCSRRALPTRVACTTNDIESCTISEPRVTELVLFPVDEGFVLTCGSCLRPLHLLVHAGIWRTTHSNNNILVQVLIPILKPLMTFKTVSMSSVQYLLNLLKNPSSYHFKFETKCLFGSAGCTFCVQVFQRSDFRLVRCCNFCSVM